MSGEILVDSNSSGTTSGVLDQGYSYNGDFWNDQISLINGLGKNSISSTALSPMFLVLGIGLPLQSGRKCNRTRRFLEEVLEEALLT